MNLNPSLRPVLLAGAILFFAAGAQAAVPASSPFQLAQTTTTTTPAGTTTETTTTTDPVAPPPAVDPVAEKPVTSTTQVEVHNEAPAAQQPAAQAPDIKIEMPDMPDVNIAAPAGNSGGTDTVTERSETVIMTDNNGDNVAADNNNFMLMLMIGLLAIGLVGAGIYFASRRRVIEVI